MDDIIIYKYLSGEATSEEEQTLLAWLQESPSNQEVFFEIKAVWHSKQQAVFGNEERLVDSLGQLNKRILSHINKEKKKRNLLIRWSSVAAVFLLLVVVAVYNLTETKINNQKTLLSVYSNEASGDSVQIVTLADGTQVWLAAHTTLSSPEVFSDDVRKVYLEGTAFFDVAKDPQHPFIVHTDIAEITVLGTSFSVNSRVPGDKGETILMSGSVLLKQLQSNKEVRLLPGQQAVYSKVSSKIEVNEVDANTLTSWRFGIISLTKVSIGEIIQKLEDTYQVKIKMDYSGIKDNRYNFSFKRSNNLEKVLEQLTCITHCKAEIAD